MVSFGFTEAVRRTLATKFHGISDSWDSVLSIPVVIRSYIYDLTNLKPAVAMGFDGNTNPITTVGISKWCLISLPKG